jgi:cation-transporting P-type ATPase E
MVDGDRGLSRHGLSEAEAAHRLAARGPAPPPGTSRSYASIVRANVLTVFNVMLGVAGGMTLAFGDAQDALFLGVLVGNAGIGSIQEIRAKRVLDRMSALVAPHATVVRDGEPRRVEVDEVVVGDLLQIGPGDRLVADGTLVESRQLRLDESILTGESRLVERSPGDEVRSGSFAVEGTGAFAVTAVGDESYAMRVTGQARSFRHRRSPLERALNRLLYVLLAVMIPLALLVGYGLWHRHVGLHRAVPTAVAAVVTLIPEGLVLLTVLTYAVGAVAMARRGALAQQLNAIESLASVDVVCLDKTGTLTEPRLRVVELVGPDGLAGELGAYAASASVRNPTLEAISERYPGAAEELEDEVPFASRRRFGAQRRGGVGYVLGAPEHFALDGLEGAARQATREGRRVLAFARSGSLEAERPHAHGLVLLAEELRPAARATVDWLRRQGVELKVLSGDRPETVASIARDAGIDGKALDATELPEGGPELEQVLRDHAIFGRVSADGKRRIVETLRAGGAYVAMIGDGVNDVPALKAAQLAIAQGSGTQMARSVADVVLVRDDFSALPPMVEQGRKILRNVQRVSKLFVTKSAFAAFLILSIGLSKTAYPLLPRQLTLAATLTIGIPGFFLALAPSSGRYESRGFLRELGQFALPAGTAAGLGVVSSYLFALNLLGLHLVAARTVAVTVLVLVGLFLILALEASGRKRSAAVSALCAGLLAAYAVALALPPVREFFALAAPGPGVILAALGGSAIAIASLVALDDRFVPGR